MVDDDADDQFLLELAFQRIHPPIGIKQLYDGDELLPHLEKATSLPKLILLDLNMVRQNGFDTLRALREAAEYAHLPVIILTTSSAETDRTQSQQLKADGFLTKPLTNDDTVSMLQLLAHEWL